MPFEHEHRDAQLHAGHRRRELRFDNLRIMVDVRRLFVDLRRDRDPNAFEDDALLLVGHLRLVDVDRVWQLLARHGRQLLRQLRRLHARYLQPRSLPRLGAGL